MKKLIQSALICFLIMMNTTQVRAQEQQVQLDFSQQPNRSVQTIINSSNSLSMLVEGDPELISKNKARGISNPFKFSQYKTNRSTSHSGAKSEDGSIPFQIILDEILSYSENEHGDRINIPSPMEKLIGMKMQGITTADGKMQITHIEGENLDKKTQDLFTTAFSAMNSVEKGPDHPMKVGDSFETKQPMVMPMPNGQPITINTVSTYKLVKIENNKAFFDVLMRFEMFNDPETVSFQVNGNGSGLMQYNIKTGLRERYQLTMDMNMELKAGKVGFSSKVTSSTTIEQFITKPKSVSDKPSHDPFNAFQAG